MDMEISALPSTPRAVSPVPEVPTPAPPEVPKEEKPEQPDINKIEMPKKTGLGSLMQAAKKEVHVPEFDMGAFGF